MKRLVVGVLGLAGVVVPWHLAAAPKATQAAEIGRLQAQVGALQRATGRLGNQLATVRNDYAALANEVASFPTSNVEGLENFATCLRGALSVANAQLSSDAGYQFVYSARNC